ncbi:MAG: tRNA adenosine(34) deaminase TadA [Sutterella wadsworthensis]|nr:tRNA adenosine(34) deaminase TadA [Sutterella wadsworthensis]
MYTFISKDYSVADIETFSALTIRRGSSLESLARTSNDYVRVVVGAWLLSVPKTVTRDEALTSAERFLSDPGQWLNVTPEALLAEALSLGLMNEGPEGLTHDLMPRPGVTARRLTDELESAQAILAARRARTREVLQAKNRAVNSGEPPVDDEADQRFMREALKEAQAAADAGEVPVGAVLVDNGVIVARAGNRTLRDGDPTAHAEMLVLREGAKVAKNHRLTNATLYVTLEPCPMCAGGIVQARPSRVVFGASDPRMGAVGGALSLFDLPGINHRPWVRRGVLADDAKALLTTFFAQRRTVKEEA